MEKLAEKSISQLVQQFDHVYIDRSAQDSAVAKRFQALFPSEKISLIAEAPSHRGELSAEEFSHSKRNLLLTEFKGQFFKQCPGAKPGLVCCNYFVLNLGLQCNMNCSYCYLQSYLNTPLMTIYTNIERALEELAILATAHPDKPFRVGTGETIDSLSTDPLTLYSHQLIEFFRRFPKWTLELKTKSNQVEHFLGREHAGNVLVSWSINPQYIVESEEHGTASLSQRLTAAEKCLARDFKVAFHMDPVIWHPEWQANYGALVDEITSRFSAQQIPHISLGALRFQPEQRHIMRERFGMKSLVTSAEVFSGRDGKLRYDSRLRNEMFDFILKRFQAADPRWRVALCMETPESWVTTMDGSPRKNQNIAELFRPLPKPQATPDGARV